MNVIDCSGISKSFDTGDVVFQALKEVDLKIKKGDFVAIVGPSGSGKSTLMNILGLLDRPSTGEYVLDGHDTAHMKERTLATLRNKKIGFVFQNFNLLNRTSAVDNVALPMIYAGINKLERTKKAQAALTRVGLAEKINNKPNQLSGGQQQRVAIARSLVTDPEVILADEPTGNLDSKTGDEIMKIFQDLNKEGKTIVMITHSMDLAHYANRIVQIKDGELKSL